MKNEAACNNDHVFPIPNPEQSHDHTYSLLNRVLTAVPVKG